MKSILLKLIQCIKFLFNRLFARKKYRPFKVYLLNFLIATLVIVILQCLDDLMWFQHKKDQALDFIMPFVTDYTPRLANDKEIQRMAMIEIDQKTYRAWGSPILTPRDKLKNLIEAAVNGGANVIAVDIELSWWSDGCIHEAGKTTACSASDTKADDSLAKYLKKLNERKDDKAPVIILTQTYHSQSDTNILNQKNFLVRPPSFLDKELKEEKNVFWGSTFFKIESDHVPRRWHLAPLVCKDKHLAVVPSMQLLVAVGQLYADNNAAQVIRNFKQKLNNWANQLPCDVNAGTTIAKLCKTQDCPDLTITLPKKTGISEKQHIINLAAGRDTERVNYRIAPYDEPKSDQKQLIDIENALTILTEGADVENQIVFIGNTHQESDDFHPIPIRENNVSGVYVLANAVDTILRFGQEFKVAEGGYKILAFILVILISTWMYSSYKTIQAFWFTIGLVFLASLALNKFVTLPDGIAVDMAVPLLAIQFIQMLILPNWIRYKIIRLDNK